MASQKWHSKQKGSFDADGSYLLEPPALRARVRAQLKCALKRY